MMLPAAIALTKFAGDMIQSMFSSLPRSCASLSRPTRSHIGDKTSQDLVLQRLAGLADPIGVRRQVGQG
jgi:hypothetical protein